MIEGTRKNTGLQMNGKPIEDFTKEEIIAELQNSYDEITKRKDEEPWRTLRNVEEENRRLRTENENLWRVLRYPKQ